MEPQAFVHWPGAPLTESLVLTAIKKLSLQPAFVPLPLPLSACVDTPILQWATYDSIDHELTLLNPSSVLASSFTIRKTLIRKHFLHRCILSYTTKYRESSLIQYVPRTWDFEISYVDELDELWGDELWDLAKELEQGTHKWWILKPGMADRGMGIRLFNTKEDLQHIFEDFEKNDDDTENEEEDPVGTTDVPISQLRHFVIQEYLTSPVLIDPMQSLTIQSGPPALNEKLEGRKFHLRAYCVASGALTVYLYPRILALFSSESYCLPSPSFDSAEGLDLRPHLTNTCLQGAEGEANVRLLHELVGCSVLSGNEHESRDPFTEKDVASIMDQVADALSETFKAALQMPVHFQPLPNAFELFGVDFLVQHSPPDSTNGRFQVKLLEFNSEPAIEMTGRRLRWVLEDLFELIGKTCVEHFFDDKNKPCRGEFGRSCVLRKCLTVNLHG